MLKLEEGPHRGRRDDAGIADGKENAIGQRAGASGHINDDEKPTVCQPVVSNAWIAGEIVTDRRREHGSEEDIRVYIQNAIRQSGCFDEGTDATIYRDNDL